MYNHGKPADSYTGLALCFIAIRLYVHKVLVSHNLISRATYTTIPAWWWKLLAEICMLFHGVLFHLAYSK